MVKSSFYLVAESLLTNKRELLSLMTSTLSYAKEEDPDKADFYLFAGGIDLDPKLYCRPDFEKHSWVTNLKRDQEEAFYVIRARLTDKPAIGICRGFQLLNVMAGSELIPDISGHRNGVHPVKNETKSDKIQHPMGRRHFRVNSSHHQAVHYDEVWALEYEHWVYSEKNILEGGYCPTYQFGGTQYHPEYSNCPKDGVEYFKHILSNFAL